MLEHVISAIEKVKYPNKSNIKFNLKIFTLNYIKFFCCYFNSKILIKELYF